MNNDFFELEAELRRRRPTALSADLVSRIGRDLTVANRPKRPSWWWSLPLSTAAVAVLGFLWMTDDSRIQPRSYRPQSPEARGTAAEVLKPVTMENVLYAAQNEGLVSLADGSRARRERLQYIDTIVWRNLQSNVSVTWTLQRQEIRVIPVTYQ